MKRTITFILLGFFALLASGCAAKTVYSGEFTLQSEETLRGDLVIYSGDVTLEEGSRVTGNVLMSSGNLYANGEIDGNIVMTSGDIYLGSKSVVHGDINNTSGDVHRTEGSRIERQALTTAGATAGFISKYCVLPVLFVVFLGVGLYLWNALKRKRPSIVGPPEATPADSTPIQMETPTIQTPAASESMIKQLGRYEILEKIGQGGFAIVYRGRDTELDRLVALKELKPILLDDTTWVKHFRREAQTIARLDHPRIIPIYDVYETEGRLFIVMRLVNGPGLEDLITSQGRLPWSEAVETITAVAEGLDYAHAQSILHRDLKPANILIDQERGPMLSDFGLAKLAGEHSLSSSGNIVGTPHYIAPEAWEGQSATPQTDIYALGCILYEMLTGEKVFKGETPPIVMMAHFKPLVLPKVWPEGVPAGVADVLSTALANKPADRYATAREMVEALAGWQKPNSG
jgi:tRNA A-37 threonylcarbamoyl transferase component Bud32